MKRDDVDSLPDLLRYLQEQVGTSGPTVSTMGACSRECKAYFHQYPDCTWGDLTWLADWAKTNHRRFAHPVTLLKQWPDASRSGFLPEHIHEDPLFEQQMSWALEIEADPLWQQRLISSYGKYRYEVFREWVAHRT